MAQKTPLWRRPRSMRVITEPKDHVSTVPARPCCISKPRTWPIHVHTASPNPYKHTHIHMHTSADASLGRLIHSLPPPDTASHVTQRAATPAGEGDGLASPTAETDSSVQRTPHLSLQTNGQKVTAGSLYAGELMTAAVGRWSSLGSVWSLGAGSAGPASVQRSPGRL